MHLKSQLMLTIMLLVVGDTSVLLLYWGKSLTNMKIGETGGDSGADAGGDDGTE